MSNKYWQQGDLKLQSYGFPVGLKEVNSPILVESAVTRHTHAIHGAAKVLTDGKTKFIHASEPFEVIHPEHKTLRLPAGQYRVDAILEYDHFAEEARRVVD